MKKDHIHILKYFLRLGSLGFGGPLALIAQMQKDLVEKENWMPIEDFNAAFSLIKAMPGPVAFMTAVFLGRHRGGILGGFLAAFGLVFPAAVLMILFSVFFAGIQNLTSAQTILLGMQICALGVILGSVKGLVKNTMYDPFFWVLVAIAGAINFKAPELEPIFIIGFGLMIVTLKYFMRANKRFDLALLFLVCFKAGALVFGSGLAIVPMLKNDVVEKYHWLNSSEFLNALSFGQMTPGPVVITATFIGHHLHGLVGAIVATIAIFLASFTHMMTWFPLVIKKLAGKVWINDFIFGAVAAVVGPIIVTVIKLYMGVGINFLSAIFLLVAFGVTLKNRLPLWSIIPGGGVIYYLITFLKF